MGAELHAIEESRRDIWDYAEVHVYDQWSVELQEFMEEVCIVEQFDLQMAQQITKKKDAGRLIQQAKEAGNFLIEFRECERSVYELIPPMKHSMRLIQRLDKQLRIIHLLVHLIHLLYLQHLNLQLKQIK